MEFNNYDYYRKKNNKVVIIYDSSLNNEKKLKQEIEELKKRGILVRPKEWPDGGLALRVTIGTLKNTKKFIKTFDEILVSST